MADIFISYSKKDRLLAEQLAGLLEEIGFTVWWDAELIPAEEFREEIRRQVQAARAVIVIWSDNSAKSAFVIDEADLARETGKLISTLAEGFSASRVPLGFRNTHMTALSDGEALIRGLASRGLTPGKPVSSFLLALFRDRIASARKAKSWALPGTLLLLVVAAAAGGAVYAFQLGKPEPRSPVEHMSAMYSYYDSRYGQNDEARISQRFDGLWAVYIRKLQTHVLTSDLRIAQKEENATMLYARNHWEPSIVVSPEAEQAILGKGYVATCVEFSATENGPVSTIGIVRKLGTPRIANHRINSVSFEPAEASVIATLSKEHRCNYRL